MNKKLLLLPAVITAVIIGSLGYMGIQEVSAHQSMSTDFGTIIIGHDNEPSFGHEKGVWLGMHATEVILRDGDNTISDAKLYVDKYYFKDVKAYNKAKSLSDATQISLGNSLSEVRGEDGTYHSNQVIADGIYGYHIYGDVTDVDSVDVTLFCLHPDMDNPGKFEDGPNAPSEFDFGCPRDINDLKFPSKNKK